MVVAFIFLVLVIVLIVYWKVQTVRSKCVDVALFRRRIGARGVIRIAVICDDAILLRPFRDGNSGGSWDLTMESFVGVKESVEDALLRMVASLGISGIEEVRFCLKHRSGYVDGRSAVYLFVVHCSNDGVKEWEGCGDCVLWSVDSIEGNLGMGVFDDKFEEEYPHLRFVLDTWRSVSEGKYGLPYLEGEDGEV